MKLKNPNNTLIIAPAWIGDMVISHTLYQLLKQHDPTQHISILAPSSTLALATRMPEVSQVIAQPLGHGQLNLKQRWQLARQLRGQFSRALVLPNSLKSALIPWFARIPRRIGWLGEQRRILLNDVRILNKAQYPTLVARYARLALDKNESLPAVLPRPRLTINHENQQACLKRLGLTVTNQPILALCPGAEYGPAKRWPINYFAEVAQHYISAGWQVWIFGGPKEIEIGTQLQNLTQQTCVNLINQTSLLDAVDLLALTSAVLTNDSGLMHLACAVDKPVVALYGSSSPEYTPPLGARVKILTLKLNCSPCFKRECPLTGAAHFRCLLDLMPARAIAALQELVT
jgi:heptosyltransferase-2